MNRLILKHGALVTFFILAIFAWFIYRQFILVHSPVLPFIIVAIVLWALGTFLFIYFWPAITCNAYKRVILQRGFGSGPVPMNALYAIPYAPSSAAPASSLMATGAGELLYVAGWLDLSKAPLVLHVPDFAGRYYSIQFTDPSNSVDFAYVGKRTTGTAAGEFLITGPRWYGEIPPGMKQISSPNTSVMALGRALVEAENDVAGVYALTSQIQVRPIST